MEPIELCFIANLDIADAFHKFLVDDDGGKVVLGYKFIVQDLILKSSLDEIRLTPDQARALGSLLLRKADRADEREDSESSRVTVTALSDGTIRVLMDSRHSFETASAKMPIEEFRAFIRSCQSALASAEEKLK